MTVKDDEIEITFNEEERRWVPLIGQFIFDFANIEDFLDQVIQHHLLETQIIIDDLSTSLPKRIYLFEKILVEDVLKNSKNLTDIKRTIKKLQPLIKVRNLIAHNSLGLGIYEKDGELRIGGFEINGKKDKDFILNYATFCDRALELSYCRKKLGEIMLEFYSVTHDKSKQKSLAKLLKK